MSINKEGFILTPNGVSVFTNGKSYTASKDHISYTKIIEKLKKKDYKNLDVLFNTVSQIEKAFPEGTVKVADGKVFLDGEEVHNAVCIKIIEYTKNGFDTKPLVEFLKKLMKNPSNNSVNSLYSFLEKHGLIILENGNFLSYKSVTPEFKDYWTQTIDNSVGQTVKMQRNKISDDVSTYCHVGLHCGSMKYVKSYHGGVNIIVVEVNPENVVCVPKDYDAQKMRVCEYTVVDVYKEEYKEPERHAYYDADGRKIYDEFDKDDDKANYGECDEEDCPCHEDECEY